MLRKKKLQKFNEITHIEIARLALHMLFKFMGTCNESVLSRSQICKAINCISIFAYVCITTTYLYINECIYIYIWMQISVYKYIWKCIKSEQQTKGNKNKANAYKSQWERNTKPQPSEMKSSKAKTRSDCELLEFWIKEKENWIFCLLCTMRTDRLTQSMV